MSEPLGRSQLSGTFLVTNATPGSRLVRIPAEALTPAQVSIKNRHASAVVFCKWASLSQTNAQASLDDAGVVLEPYESYTWDTPPRDAMLLGLSTVLDSPCHIEAVWGMPESPQL